MHIASSSLANSTKHRLLIHVIYSLTIESFFSVRWPEAPKFILITYMGSFSEMWKEIEHHPKERTSSILMLHKVVPAATSTLLCQTRRPLLLQGFGTCFMILCLSLLILLFWMAPESKSEELPGVTHKKKARMCLMEEIDVPIHFWAREKLLWKVSSMCFDNSTN